MAEGVLRRGVIHSAVLLAVAMSAVAVAPVRAQQTPNSTPLAFGMDAQQASLALGTTLNYVSGRPGDELYLALANVKGSALSNRSDRLYLQFRRGRLQGWKGDWSDILPCCSR